MENSFTSDQVSTTSSNDMLWETIKMDLDQNRAYQSDLIQTLKGQTVRFPTERQKARKVERNYRLHLKHLAKKKAFKLAVQSLKALLATKPKRKKKSQPPNVDFTSTMYFKVSEQHKTVNEMHLEKTANQTVSPEDSASLDHGKDCGRVDRSVQTAGGTILKDKFSQTLDPWSYLPSRCAFELVNPYIPFHLPPVHLCCSRHIVSNCCANNSHHQMCSHSVSSETCLGHKHLSGGTGVSDTKMCNTNETANSQYSLKEICEELLAQLSSKKRAEASENNNFSSRNSTVEKSPINTSSITILPKPPNLNCDQNIQSGNELATSSSVIALTSLPEATINMQSQSTLPSALCLLSTEEAPQTVPSQDISEHAVTPDLLRVERSIGVGLLSKKEEIRQSVYEDGSSLGSKLNLEGAPNQLEQQQPEQTVGRSEIVFGGNTLDVLQENLVADANGNTQIEFPTLSHVEPGGKGQITSNDGSDRVLDSFSLTHQSKTVQSDVFAEDFTENSNQEDKKTVGSSNSPTHQSIEISEEIKNGGDQSLESLPPAQENLTEQTNDSLDSGCVESPNPVEVLPNCNIDKGSKVLSRKHNIDFSNVTREELQNSPAFEEMDPTEMESVLLIWRQQEQLHKDVGMPEKSSPTSPGNVFRKVNWPQELPPELRHTRILQPPPVQKNNATSALDILDVEAEKPLSEDDDIPESSPHCDISPPKRRKLKLTLSKPAPLVIQKSKENLIEGSSASPIVTSTHGNPSESTPTIIKETPSGLRTSNRLKAASSQKLDESSADQTIAGQNEKPKKESKDTKAKILSSKTSLKKNKSKQLDQSTDDSTATSCSKGTNVKKIKKDTLDKIIQNDTFSNNKTTTVKEREDKNNTHVQQVDSTTILSTEGATVKKSKKEKVEKIKQNSASSIKKLTSEDEGDKNNFHDQIQERVSKLKRKWLQEKSDDEVDVDVVDLNSTPSDTAQTPSSQKTEDSQDVLSQTKATEMTAVPTFELGRAHDLATHILLNPWRGISARRVTRGFVSPTYESKIIARALWDLRSNTDISKIVDRILAIGWKGYDPRGVRALVAMFTLSFSRSVPFVIDGMKGEEDETGSLSSDAELHSKKKSLPIRLVATKQIFKGECIEGLNGLLRKPSAKEKENLRSWNFLKFKERRDWALFGPLAYLKRDDSNFNTQAVFLKADELIAVRATRLILSGEVLLVSMKEIGKRLVKVSGNTC